MSEATLKVRTQNDDPEQNYAKLAGETKQSLFPSEFPHPWNTAPEGTEKGSAAIIEFTNDQNPKVHKVPNSTELRRWLNKSGPTALAPPLTAKRLIILEDLDRRYVNVIGAHIGVPPIVFLAHAAGPFVDDVVDEDCLAHDSDQYWRIKTFQLHKVDSNPKKALGIYIGKDTVLDRIVQYLDGDRAFCPSAHLVSFWSTTTDSDGSWTALLLVDPVLENVIHKLHMTPPSKEPAHNIALQHSDLCDSRVPIPARFSVERLPKDPQQWHKPPTMPLSLSFFESLIHAYTYQEHTTALDPRSATDVIRKLLLSSWQGMIKAKEIDFDNLWEKISFSEEHYASGSSWYSVWDSSWKREYFPALTHNMMIVMNRMNDIDNIFHTLYPAAAADTPSTPPPEGTNLHVKRNNNNTHDRELQSWNALRSRAHALHARFATTLATYEQRAAIEQSVLANEQSVLSNKQSMLANEQSVLAYEQARSVGRLTALATVLVPFSVVAGIFSMSGRFAAGEDLFWVFWILAVSISGGLVGWLFFERAARGLESVMDWCGRLRGREGKGKTKKQGAVLPMHKKDT